MDVDPDVAVPTMHLCGPRRKCPDGTEHEYTGWEEWVDKNGCGVGTAVCRKCGHRAIDDAYWF